MTQDERPFSREEQFENSMAYHKITPDSKQVALDMQELRQAAKDFGTKILFITHSSREQSLALTHVEEALMWAIKQVAITQLPIAEPLSK